MKPSLSIDPEFQGLCPKQTEEELKLLRESIREEGCREKIAYWEDGPGNPIVDGMTRFAMCMDENIDFEVRPVTFPDRRAARIWIRTNQLSRRNLSDTQRAIVRGQLYNEMKQDKPTDNLLGGIPKGQHCPLGKPPESVADKLGAKEHISGKTVKRDGKLAEAVEKLTASTKTQITGTKVEDSKTELTKLANLPAKQQEAVAAVIGSGKAKTVAKAMEVAKVTKPEKPKQGKQARDPRLWNEIEGLLGKALNRVDALHKAYPNGPLYKILLGQVKQAMATLNGWKETAQ